MFKLQHATRAGRYDVYKEYTALVDTQSTRLATLRGLFELREGVRAAGADRRGRAGQRDRQALRHRRDVVRLHLEGGARDPRHRDEPHRRQVQHRRGRRRRRPLHRPTPTATCAARRSSRWRRAASASRRSTWSTPTTCRSRWPRAPSPAKAASSRAPRSTRGSPRPGTPRPGVGPHQPAAAPRHLLHRGHQAAHPRPQELQPRRARPREARRAGRRGHGRRGRGQGALRRRAHLRATTAAPAPRRSRRSSTRARRGSSASPRPSRRWCATGCATASSCSATAS